MWWKELIIYTLVGMGLYFAYLAIINQKFKKLNKEKEQEQN